MREGQEREIHFKLVKSLLIVTLGVKYCKNVSVANCEKLASFWGKFVSQKLAFKFGFVLCKFVAIT